MPYNDIVIGPKEDGHIDLVDGLISCGVAASVEVREDEGTRVTILHLDVRAGEEIDTPFSVGIPLSDIEVMVLVSSLGGNIAGDLRMTRAMDRLN